MKVSTLLVPGCLAYVTNAMIRDPAFAGVQAANSMEKDLLIRDINEIPALTKRAEDVEQPDNMDLGQGEPSNESEESAQVHLQKRGQDHSSHGAGGGGKKGGGKGHGKHDQKETKSQRKARKQREHDENERLAAEASRTARNRPEPPTQQERARNRQYEASSARIARREAFRDEAFALGYIRHRRDFNAWLDARPQGMHWGAQDRERLADYGIPVNDDTDDPAPAFGDTRSNRAITPPYSEHPQYWTPPPSFHSRQSSQQSGQSSGQGESSQQPQQPRPRRPRSKDDRDLTQGGRYRF